MDNHLLVSVNLIGSCLFVLFIVVLYRFITIEITDHDLSMAIINSNCQNLKYNFKKNYF